MKKNKNKTSPHTHKRMEAGQLGRRRRTPYMYIGHYGAAEFCLHVTACAHL